MGWNIFTICLILCLSLEFIHCAMTEAQLKSTGKVARNVCQPKSKVTDEQIENMHKGIWDDDPATMCFAYCLMNLYKLVNKADGTFNEESALKQIGSLPTARQAPILQSVANCKGKDVGADKCETSYRYLKCVYFDNPGNYFAP